MTKHTKGPWAVIDQSYAAKAPEILNSGGDLVCQLYGGQWQVVEANARLIASAPDLLEALSAIQSMMDKEPTDFALIDEIIFTAIAKATGESK